MPLTQRQIYRRRRIVVASGLAVLLGSGFYLPFTLLAPLDPVAATVLPYESTPADVVELAMPAFPATAIGAVGFEGVLASSGTTDPLPMASITKIITSLVVLDAHPLEPGDPGDDIVFGESDEDYYDSFQARNGTVKPVHNGLVLSELEVHAISLLASANNYALSLALWAFGSQDAYLSAASGWLDAHGLDSTTVTDPTGIEPTNLSTAADLVELAKIAAENPIVSALVATSSTEVPGVGLIENRNTMLGVQGIDGIKTGTLTATGASLLFSTDVPVGEESITVVGVVLGAADHPAIESAVGSLLPGVVAGFREVVLVRPGEVFAEFETIWGGTARAVAASGYSIVTWSNTPVFAVVDVDEVRFAVAGTDIGEVTFTVGEKRITVPLELDNAIEDPGPWWRLSHPFELI